MTEEQIGQKAKEYSLRVNGHYYPIIPEDFNKSIGEVTENAFVEGANFANKHWQEKTRWIPVTERLPENQNIVLLKTDEGCFFTGYLHGKHSGFITYGDIAYEIVGNITHWREIV